MNRPLRLIKEETEGGWLAVPLRWPKSLNLNVHLQKARPASLYNLAGLAVSAALLLMRGQ